MAHRGGLAAAANALDEILSFVLGRAEHHPATANQFKAGHRICLDITCMDVPTGTGAMTNVEYIPYHVCSSKTVSHKIYRDAERPSHLLLPVIADPGSGSDPSNQSR